MTSHLSAYPQAPKAPLLILKLMKGFALTVMIVILAAAVAAGVFWYRETNRAIPMDQGGRIDENKIVAASSGSAVLLCNIGHVICVSNALRHSLLSNPLDISVHIFTSTPTELDWNLEDANGASLASGSTANQYLGHNPFLTTLSSSSQLSEIKDYILQPAQTDHGILILRPWFNKPTGPLYSSDLEVPLALNISTTALNIMVPKDSAAYQDWVYTVIIDNSSTATPKLDLPFTPKTVTIMRTNDYMGATTDAALQFTSDLAQSPVYLQSFRVTDGTAYVAVAVSGWAGITWWSLYADNIVKNSILGLPGVKNVQWMGAQ